MRGIRHKVLEKLKAYKESFSADDVHRRQKEVHAPASNLFVVYVFA
jgi:Fe2+ or Zn2+ uptake regulation protein